MDNEKADTRSQQLYAQIRQLAYDKGPKAKMPTVREMVERFDTSTVTITQVLAKLEAHNIISRHQGSGIFVSPTIHQKHVSIILDASFFAAPAASPFWLMLWSAIVGEAQRRNETGNISFDIHMAIPSKYEKERVLAGLLSRLDAKQIDAVLHVGLQEPALTWLLGLDIPVIGYANRGHYTVAMDNQAFMRYATTALIERGCQKIGLWRPVALFRKLYNKEYEEADVFFAALREHNHSVDQHLIKTNAELLQFAETDYVQKRETHQEQGYRTAMEVFGQPQGPKPDGLVVTDDMMMSGALVALQQLGIKPGTDVLIASHANSGSPILFGYEHQLLLIEFNVDHVAHALFSLVDQVLAGQTPSASNVKVVPLLRQQP